MTHAEALRHLGAGFAKVTQNVYHYWRFDQVPPYVIWEEQGTDPHDADDSTVEQGYEGYVHLFTKADADPLIDAVEQAMSDMGMTYRTESVQYEDETKLIHHEWSWSWLG